MMTLSELIAAYGDDKVKFQKLDDCADTMNYDHKKGTKITFGTDVQIGLDGTKQMGLVVWMDRDQVEKIIEADKRTERAHKHGC